MIIFAINDLFQNYQTDTFTTGEEMKEDVYNK